MISFEVYCSNMIKRNTYMKIYFLFLYTLLPISKLHQLWSSKYLIWPYNSQHHQKPCFSSWVTKRFSQLFWGTYLMRSLKRLFTTFIKSFKVKQSCITKKRIHFDPYFLTSDKKNYKKQLCDKFFPFYPGF